MDFAKMITLDAIFPVIAFLAFVGVMFRVSRSSKKDVDKLKQERKQRDRQVVESRSAGRPVASAESRANNVGFNAAEHNRNLVNDVAFAVVVDSALSSDDSVKKTNEKLSSYSDDNDFGLGSSGGGYDSGSSSFSDSGSSSWD